MKNKYLIPMIMLIYIASAISVHAQDNVFLYTVKVYAVDPRYDIRMEFLLEVDLNKNIMKLTLIDVYPHMRIGESLIRDLGEAIKAPSKSVADHFILHKGYEYSIEDGYIVATFRASIYRGELVKESFYDANLKILVREKISGFYIVYVSGFRSIKIPVEITLELTSILRLKGVDMVKIVFSALSFIIGIGAIRVYLNKHKYQIF